MKRTDHQLDITLDWLELVDRAGPFQNRSRRGSIREGNQTPKGGRIGHHFLTGAQKLIVSREYEIEEWLNHEKAGADRVGVSSNGKDNNRERGFS
jgi:hypothetical protein